MDKEMQEFYYDMKRDAYNEYMYEVSMRRPEYFFEHSEYSKTAAALGRLLDQADHYDISHEEVFAKLQEDLCDIENLA